MPGNDDNLKDEFKEEVKNDVMIDLDAVDNFINKVATDLNYSPEETQKLKDNNLKLYEDYQKNPQYYIDKDLEKERMNRLFEAEMLKTQRAEEKKKAEELGDKTNDAFENLTGTDINHDGKIGDKPIEEAQPDNVVVAPEQPQPEQPQPEQPKPEEAKPELKIFDNPYDIVEKACAEDKERYPDKYDTPEHAAARQKEVGAATLGYIEHLKDDYATNPHYYTNQADIDDRKQMLRNAIEADFGLHPKGSKIEKMAKENPISSLQSPSKTVTDLVNAGKKPEECVSFEQLLKVDNVRMQDGTPFPQGLKPWEVDQMIEQIAQTGQPLYVQTPKGVQEIIIADRKTSLRQPVNIDPNEKLVDFNVKKTAMEQLQEVQRQMNNIPESQKMSKEFKDFKEATNQTLKSLQNTAFKGKFEKTLDEYTAKAEKFLVSSALSKNTKELQDQKKLAIQVRNVNNDVQKGKAPEKAEPNLQDTLRFEIACKAVKSYSNSFKDSKDEVKQGLAEHINSNEEAFLKEVDKAMKDPGFVELFGDSKHPCKDEDFLKKCTTSKGSDLIKAVNQKNKELDQKQLTNTKEANKHVNRDLRQPVSSENKEAFKENVIKTRQELLKNYKQGKDPAMDKLMFDLEVAEIRFKTAGKYGINYNKLSAELADDAEAVHKSMLEKGESVNTHWFRPDDSPVYAETGKLIQMDDCIKENKSIAENPYNAQEAMKRDYATKIVLDTQKLLEKDPDKNVKELTSLADKRVFDKKVDEIMNSDAFKDMTNGKSQEQLSKMLEQSSQNAAIEYGKMKNQLDRGTLSKEAYKQKQETEKNIQEARQREAKQKEKEEVKSVSAPSAVFR